MKLLTLTTFPPEGAAVVEQLFVKEVTVFDSGVLQVVEVDGPGPTAAQRVRVYAPGSWTSAIAEGVEP